MRVTRLQAENFKRLVAVDITPDSDVVVISGANGQGKSSVLDAIWAALAGRAGAVDAPVRLGEDYALVELDLGEVQVRKRWNEEGKATLTVTSAAGARFPNPQKMLDDLLGRFSFDPLRFAQAKPAEQRDVLLELSGLRDQLEEIDRERRAAYDERTAVNREVKRAEGALSQMPPVAAGTPDEEVDVAALVNKARELRDVVSRRDQALRDYHRLKADLEQAIADGREADQELRVWGGVELAPGCLASLEESIERSGSINQAVQQKRQRARVEAELKHAQTSARQLTATIEDWDAAKTEAISEAELPVPGLGFDEDGVTLNGVPFSQASAAEQLRTSVAIAMAANPNVRVIRVADGSLLDSRNMALIEQMAREKDYQVWVERVDETGELGIVIEEGQVKS